MFSRRRDRQVPRRQDLTAFVDEGSEIEGRYTFRGTVMLNGRFSGEIGTTDTLVIGEKGVVTATVRAGTIIVSGQLSGDIVATQRLELRRTARVSGEIETPALVVDAGAVVEGRCRMTATKTTEAPAPARDLTIVKR